MEAVITALVTIIGLFLTVGTPILKLNTNITKLTVTMEGLDDKLKQMDEDNHDSHKRIWAKNDQQDLALHDHETRITILEGK